MKPAANVATCILAFIAIIHVLRVVFQVPVTAGDVEFPMRLSIVGAILFGGLAVWLRLEQRSEG